MATAPRPETLMRPACCFADSSNMSPSCSALCARMYLLSAFMSSNLSLSSGPSPNSFFLSSKNFATSPSDSDPASPTEILVSGMSRPPPVKSSPLFSHFCISSSRRFLLCARIRASSSSDSSDPSFASPPSALALAFFASISSRQAPFRLGSRAALGASSAAGRSGSAAAASAFLPFFFVLSFLDFLFSFRLSEELLPEEELRLRFLRRFFLPPVSPPPYP
mmetsp:Transcript_28638/g.75849  ORF Transcript_28638/g.75849 Transcript_28638/m.75849 type:complete len:221 (+) Transcript_28638:1112-1774(+)